MSSLLFSPKSFTEIESTRHEINKPATTKGTTMSSLFDPIIDTPSWPDLFISVFTKKKNTLYSSLILQFDTTITKLIPHSTPLSPQNTNYTRTTVHNLFNFC